MTSSVIITTYNRSEKVLELVNHLLGLVDHNTEIIVVDSSEKKSDSLSNNKQITHITSAHKNQPYQRYLGYLASRSEFILYLDDDMEIIDPLFDSKLKIIFMDTEIAGVAIRFIDKHNNTSLSKIPRSLILPRNSLILKIRGYLTGYPLLPAGQFGLCGNRGNQPISGGRTEWVSGGAFAARRVVLFQNFNFQLFDIFEKGLGMGEDSILGYGIARQGKLIFHNELFFFHNDQKDSIYTTDQVKFARRVAFSRKFLSLEKCRLDGNHLFLAKVHYNYYMIWRVLGLIINCLIAPGKERRDILKGTYQGWRLAFKFSFDKKLERAKYWENEARIDLKRNNIITMPE